MEQTTLKTTWAETAAYNYQGGWEITRTMTYQTDDSNINSHSDAHDS